MQELQWKTKSQSAITKKLLDDHETIRLLIDSLKPHLSEVYKRQSTPDIAEAKVLAHQLEMLMRTHSRCEEVVFKALENYHPLPILEIEHDEIVVKRAAFVSGITNYSFPEDCESKCLTQATDFFHMVVHHMDKEEKAIFPLVEHSLSPAEKLNVLCQMEDIKAESRVLPTEDLFRSPVWFKQFHFSVDSVVSEEIQIESLLDEESTQIQSLVLKAGAVLTPHWSPRQMILMLLQGKAEWMREAQTSVLSPGDGVLMSPKFKHGIRAVSDTRLLLIATRM